jgi:hypothetical protein
LQSELSSVATTLDGLASDADLLVSAGGGSSENDLLSRLQVTIQEKKIDLLFLDC